MHYGLCKLCSSNLTSYLNEYKLVKCKNCGLIFFDESQNYESASELYDYLYSDDPGYKQHLRQAQMIRNGVQPKLGYNKRVILNAIINKKRKYSIAEIGAGVGVVAKKLTDEGHTYLGFELNNKIASEAQKQGLPVKASGFEGLSEYENHFDAILAFEVLEHIDNLSTCFNMIVKALKRDGLIGFTVPNTDKFRNYEKVHSKLYQSTPPVHLNFFTIENLQKILPLFGLKPVILKIRPFPYLNFNNSGTYKLLFKALFGHYYGPNIICVAREV